MQLHTLIISALRASLSDDELIEMNAGAASENQWAVGEAVCHDEQPLRFTTVSLHLVPLSTVWGDH